MVRIVATSALGFGDYGCSISDREVDGLSFDESERPVKPVIAVAAPVVVATKVGKPLAKVCLRKSG